MSKDSLSIPYIAHFSDDVSDINVLGGKGLSLIRMANAGLPIPPGFVITTDVHKDFKNKGVISSVVKNELYAAYDKLGASRVAVRSSATSEDSETASWAGQFESFLNIERGGFLERVRDCWASAKNAGAYAQTQGLEEEGLVLGVVVQEMVDSEVSGVAFSVNPLNHNSDEIMIEATYGLGELLVQGMVTPDNYVTLKSERSTVSSTVATKTSMLIYKDGDNKEVAVEDDRQGKPCLSEDQLQELSSLICKVEDYFGSPQDIEWALQDNKFHIIQSRPITTSQNK